ncbi:hypothetical protein [Romboutsia lituseburensis]|uniref:Uncharacterized protein n=1 Tax=Romboutsia lituseburensis DSM 797 TaxID=1121325 RepID=A0A1G9U020_9FIRM|nr:hypothetical protein [Romboutsia lituseburensis]CEH34730.1 Hypothetical protein RLITU_2147 [Romboutsia lituseburensis]SDM53400.1 hypothetical protein SAMN04515677_11439 [Romboutsia lituseburensis DSM 797]
MNVDYYIKIIGLIIPIMVFIGTIFNPEKNKTDKLKERYFEKLLALYVNEYKSHRNLNAVKFINKRYTMNDYFIPSYIFYLEDKNEKELLHKVLMVDYINNFPRKRNNISNAINSINGILRIAFIYINYFIRVLYIIAIPFTIMFLISAIIFYINGGSGSITIGAITISDIVFYILMIIIIIIISIALKYIQESITNKIYDDYTMKEIEIKQILEKREQEYNNSDSYYIF